MSGKRARERQSETVGAKLLALWKRQRRRAEINAWFELHAKPSAEFYVVTMGMVCEDGHTEPVYLYRMTTLDEMVAWTAPLAPPPRTP